MRACCAASASSAATRWPPGSAPRAPPCPRPKSRATAGALRRLLSCTSPCLTHHNVCSIRVDVFGCLRGACAKTGCTMWRRDVAGAANWSDTRILTCEVRAHPAPSLRNLAHARSAQDCGATNTAHDDCGTYEIEDPQPPMERRMEAALTGVHQSKGF